MDNKNRVNMILGDLEVFSPQKRIQSSLDTWSNMALESLDLIINSSEPTPKIQEQAIMAREHILDILYPNPDKSNPLEYRDEFLPVVVKARLDAIQECQILLDLLIQGENTGTRPR